MEAADVENTVRVYIEREIVPRLPDQIFVVSYEIVSWLIQVHTYQRSVLHWEPREELEQFVEALVGELPPRPDEAWQCTLRSHRVFDDQSPTIEGVQVYARPAEV